MLNEHMYCKMLKITSWSIICSLVISVVNCLSMPSEEHIKEAICKARRVEQDPTLFCRERGKDCRNSHNIDWSFTKELTPPQILVLCRGDNMLSFRWNNTNFTALVEYRSKDQENWSFLEATHCNQVDLLNRTSNSLYKIRVWGVLSNGSVFGPSYSSWESTTSKKSTPLQVPQLIIQNPELQDKMYEVELEWTPAEDVSCFYDFVIFDGFDGYFLKEIRNPYELFKTKIGRLEFNINYTIEVMAKSTDGARESAKTRIYFLTPSCLEAYMDLNECEPSTPEDLNVEETISEDSKDIQNPLHNVKLTWKKPDLIPDYYTVDLMVLHPNSNKTSYNISGDATTATLHNVYIGLQYQVSIAAFSAKGPSEKAHFYRNIWVHRILPIVPQTSWSTISVTLTIVGAFSLLITLVGGAIFVCHQCAKRERQERRCQYFQELEDKTPQYLDTIIADNIQDDCNDKWEIHPDKLSLGTTLGQGAFGVVRKGWLKNEDGNHEEVAVKMLQDSPSLEEKRQFLQEIDIMKSVGPHKHLVSMIGCCIKRTNLLPLLVVEYCSRGDLKTYLQTAWETITNQNFEIQYAELMDNEETLNSTKQVSNKTYYLQEEGILQPQDLLSFARQIAIGMEYLSSLHVLHRDLAARNVLVCEDKTVKVSDFGLSRDVYRDNIYYKSTSGKLPVRWMAIESLTHQVYTSQSDVWSFGILLWEIVTLGGNPYPGISTQDLPKLLENGHRMEKPVNCNNDLYNLMQNCWKKVPKERPTFTEIRNYLDKLLENVGDYLHLGVSACREMNSFRGQKYLKNKKTTSSERYVKPIIVHR